MRRRVLFTQSLLLIISLLSLSFTFIGSSAAHLQEPPVNLNRNLVLYLNFDEGEGDIAFDSSKHNNHAGLLNGPIWVKGPVATAIKFDGVDDYAFVLSNDLLTPQSFTISLWVRVRDFSASTGVQGIVKGAGGSGWSSGWRLHVRRSGKAVFVINVNNKRYGIQSSTFLSVNKWYHLAVSFNKQKGVVEIFIDGIIRGREEVPMGKIIYEGHNNPLHIGISNGCDFYNGSLDEIRLYNRPLNEKEIMKLYSIRDG